MTVPQANDGVSFDCFKEIGATFLSYAISAHAFVCFPAWSEPLLCQLRNRLLTLQYKVSVGKKRGIGELLSGGVFYPNDTWIPPGLDLIPHVEQIAVKNKIHFGVFDGVKDIWVQPEFKYCEFQNCGKILLKFFFLLIYILEKKFSRTRKLCHTRACCRCCKDEQNEDQNYNIFSHRIE